MVILLDMLLLAGLFAANLFCSRKDKNNNREQGKKKTVELDSVFLPLAKAAVSRKKSVLKRRENGCRRAEFQRSAYEPLERELKSLYPLKPYEETRMEYDGKKLSLLLLIVASCGMFLLLSEAISYGQEKWWETYEVKRPAQGEGDTTFSARISIEDMLEDEPLAFTIKEQEYEEEKAKQFLKEAAKELDSIILNKQDCWEKVRNSLNLVTEMRGGQILITWEFDRYEVIGSDGEIKTENTREEGTPVTLKGILEYKDYTIEYERNTIIYPPRKDEKAKLFDTIVQYLQQENENGKTKERMLLPDEIEGKKIIWEPEDASPYALVLLLAAASAGTVLAGKDQELKKQMKKRNEQLMMDYPDLVNKLVLLLASGMSLKETWKKIVTEYRKKTESGEKHRYAYDEMLISFYEMESGISESEAYERFGKRCGILGYLKLSTFLVQNLKRGSKGLAGMLKEEARGAFEERTYMARRLGEEAGTKLLIPMGMMLILVMALILIPACLTLS